MHDEGRDYTVNVFPVHIWTFTKQVSTLLIKPLNAVSLYTYFTAFQSFKSSICGDICTLMHVLHISQQ